jgi:TPR repeat protein
VISSEPGVDWYQKGIWFYTSKNYDSVLSYFTEAAKFNHREAQFYLGAMHEAGLGTAKNLAQGID